MTRMIKRVLLVAFIAMPVLAYAQVKPRDISTRSEDRDVKQLSFDVDKAVDEIYFRVRRRVDSLVNNYVHTRIIEVDSIFHTDAYPTGQGAAAVLVIGVGDHLDLKSYRETGIDIPAEIRMYEDIDNGNNFWGLKAPDALAVDILYQFPNSDGTSGYVLVAPGGTSGELTWEPNYNWSKIGDTLMQHVFDTIIANNSTTFTLPVSYTSSSSYRVSCTATDNTSPNINWAASNGGLQNVWSMVRIRQTSGTAFNVTLLGYTDDAANQWTPQAGDSLTCNCVASGR